jgi:hypothetical protein
MLKVLVRRVATRTQKRSCIHIENFDKKFPRQSTTYRGFQLYSVFRDGKHAIPRWGLKKHAYDV